MNKPTPLSEIAKEILLTPYKDPHDIQGELDSAIAERDKLLEDRKRLVEALGTLLSRVSGRWIDNQDDQAIEDQARALLASMEPK